MWERTTFTEQEWKTFKITDLRVDSFIESTRVVPDEVKGTGQDPVTGWSWAQIGEQSRAFHLTQGMGRWVPNGKERDWPLHLVRSEVEGPDKQITDGLPATLADLASFAGAPDIADDLQAE